MKLYRSTLAAVAGLALLSGGVSAYASQPEIYSKAASEPAIEGYDVVAYFEDGKPVEGSADFTAEYKGATWRFASADHRDMFKANPEAYAPQYGGYCAYGVSQGHAVRGDPMHWKIVDGKLYLNYNSGVQKKWVKDIPSNNAKADAEWPAVLDQ